MTADLHNVNGSLPSVESVWEREAVKAVNSFEVLQQGRRFINIHTRETHMWNNF